MSHKVELSTQVKIAMANNNRMYLRLKKDTDPRELISALAAEAMESMLKSDTPCPAGYIIGEAKQVETFGKKALC